MKFVKIFKQFNLFQPLKAKKLSEVQLNVNDTVVALNDDNSIYGVCGLISANSFAKTLPTPIKLLK